MDSRTISDQRERVRQDLAALNASWEGQIVRAVEARLAEAASEARRASVEEIHRAVRRFERCESRPQWAAALLDSVPGFCARAALWTVSADILLPLRAFGLAEDAFAAMEIPLGCAPALATAIRLRETVVALATPAEFSVSLAVLFDSVSCAVLPVVARGRTIAVLAAAGEQMDVNGLETMASLAGAAFERLAHTGPPLPDEEPALHLRAQQFARVRVAEMRLHNSEAVLRGRRDKRLYTELREEIDAARADYAGEFPALPDYLHLELVRTLANENHASLGEDYPGPLG
jgi:hypothetical protein